MRQGVALAGQAVTGYVVPTVKRKGQEARGESRGPSFSMALQQFGNQGPGSSRSSIQKDCQMRQAGEGAHGEFRACNMQLP